MTPTQNDPWIVICYEIRMFCVARKLRNRKWSNVDLSDVFVESELLHVRNLAEALSYAPGQSDDIKLSKIINIQKNSDLDIAMRDLTEAYVPTVPTAINYKVEINKRIAHMTERRADQVGYPYGALFAVMEPAIDRVIGEIKKVKNPLCPPKGSSAVAVINTPPTSSTSGNW